MSKRDRREAPTKSRKKPKLASSKPNGKSAPTSSLDAASTSSLPSSTFYVAAGSYERFLYGLECELQPGKRRKVEVKPIFHFPAHLSCIKTLAFSEATAKGKVTLVTGSTDEAVKIWDVRSRKEVGSLVVHSGVISRILYASPKLLVTASADSTLALLGTKDYSVLRTFKGHKARINDVAVHPNGRVALSVSQDRTLRMWDLLGNRTTAAGGGKEGSSSMSLGAEGDVVEWSNDGMRFAVICDTELRLYSTGMKLLHTLKAKTRFHDVRFYTSPAGDELLFVACEDGRIRIFPLPAESGDERLTCTAELVGHTRRVKELRLIKLTDSTATTLAITASTDGSVRFFDLSELEVASETAQQLESIACYDTKGSRLVCIGAVSITSAIANEVESSSEEEVAEVEASSSNSDDEEAAEAEEEWTGFGGKE